MPPSAASRASGRGSAASASAARRRTSRCCGSCASSAQRWIDPRGVRGRDRGDEPAARARRRPSWRSFCALPRSAAAAPARWSAGSASSSPGCRSSSRWPPCSSRTPRRDWVRGAGGGAGAAVAAVALPAGRGPRCAAELRATAPRRQAARALVAYVARRRARRGASSGPWLVLVLLVVRRDRARWRGARRGGASCRPPPARPGGRPAAATGGLGALAWIALKVGALSYGGGFVIIPLMQADAVDVHGWMTDGEFLNAVALGPGHPRPGRAHGRGRRLRGRRASAAALLAAAVAFAPSFAFVLLGADRFDRLLGNATRARLRRRRRPAAIGAIAGSAAPLAAALSEPWQVGRARRGGGRPARAAPRRRRHAAGGGPRRRARRRARRRRPRLRPGRSRPGVGDSRRP